MAEAVDLFQTQAPGLNAPAARCFAIEPSDEAELALVTRHVYVGGAGNLKVVTAGGDTVTLVAVPVGTLLPIRVKQVLATDTTATNLVGMT